MIWWNLILFAVAFIATALLAPKLEVENARPESLDSNTFPTASESDPVPFILGKVKNKGPNVIWYGAVRTVEIVKKVKTGFFSSKNVIQGFKYYVSLNMAVALGPNVRLHRIFIDDEEVADGSPLYDTSQAVVFTDNTINLTTIGINYETRDVLTDLDMDATTFDALTLAGDLKFELDIDFSATLNESNSLGAYLAKVVFRDEFGVDLTPIEGLASQTHTLTGTTIYMELRLRCTIPTGTREILYAGTLAPILVLYTGFNIQNTQVRILGAGVQAGEISSDIYEPELYGGELSGGGHIGNFKFYPGNYDQSIDSDIEELVGVGEVPAYRGTAHIAMPDQFIGETLTLRKMEFELSRYTSDVDGVFLGRIADGHDDINVAEAIYQVLSHEWNALSIDPLIIDLPSFATAASTLRDELNGCSMIISNSTQGKKVVQELLRQCDGVLTESTDGKIGLKLIRDDYNPTTLPIFDENDIVEMTTFSKSSWADVRSQVKVTYASRDKQSNLTAIAQNGATVNMLNGKIKTADISFPFCYDGDLANRLAARELSQLSTPLFKMTCVFNRNAYELKIGDPIKISWPKFGLTEIIMRVQRIDLGELLDNRITIELLQDTFAISKVLVATPELSGWVDDKPVPQSISEFGIAETPYFFGQRIEYPIVDGFGGVIAFPVKPNANSNSYDLLSGTATSILDFIDPLNNQYSMSGLITADYPLLSGFLTGVDSVGFVIDNLTDNDIPLSVLQSEIRTGEYGIIRVDNEWMAYEGATDNLDGTFTLDNIHRGLFGSVPELHTDNSRVFFLTVGAIGEGDISGTLLEDGDIFFKFIDGVGSVKRDKNSEIEYSFTLNHEANRPLRPRNLEVDGDRILTKFIGLSPSLSWVSSNRGSSQVVYETDSTETPDQAEAYDLDVYVDDVLNATLSSTGVTSPHIVDFTGVPGVSAEFRLTSRRTVGDLNSSLHYTSFTVSFANENVYETQLYVIEGHTPELNQGMYGTKLYVVEGRTPELTQGVYETQLYVIEG